MNPSAIPQFFKKPIGKLVLFATAVGGVLIYLSWGKTTTPATLPTSDSEVKGAASSVTVLETDIPTLKLPDQRPAPKPIYETPTIKPVNPEAPKPTPTPMLVREKVLCPINLFSSSESSSSEFSIPFGTLLQCELIITVDSSKIETPVVGMVTRNVHNADGLLVVPAGTMVHGMAQADRSRERIAGQKQFVLVFSDDQELPITGLILDHAPDPSGDGWLITDGSAGLRGTVIKTDNLAELKTILAKTAAGIAEGFIDQTTQAAQNPFGGTTTTTTKKSGLQSAMAGGLKEGISQYAQIAAEAIKRDGFFVRVPAGTEFYLYITDTLDLAKATVAGARKSEQTMKKGVRNAHSEP